MTRQPLVLVVDDEANLRRMLGAVLGAEGYAVAEASSGTEAMAAVQRKRPDAVLLDLQMPGGPDGLETLERLSHEVPGVPVIMMSGRAGLQDAVRATKLGAYHFLEKPLAPEALLLTLRAALELARARAQAQALRDALGPTATLVGSSPQMAELRATIARAAPTETRVLISGESGTGKELVAGAIHAGSARADGPFVRVNCAAIPRELIESEMFGHERGSFTGASDRRTGRFELADGGTLFLDEVGDLGVEAQAKLLRALEGGEVERVGGERPIAVDVRVVSATNKDLAARRRGTDGSATTCSTGSTSSRSTSRRCASGRATSPSWWRTSRRCSPSGSGGRWRGSRRRRWRRWCGTRGRGTSASWRTSSNGSSSSRPARPSARTTSRRRSRRTPPAPRPCPSPAGRDVALVEELDRYERTLITRALSAAAGNVAEAARRLATDRANLYRRMKRLGIGPMP